MFNFSNNFFPFQTKHIHRKGYVNGTGQSQRHVVLKVATTKVTDWDCVAVMAVPRGSVRHPMKWIRMRRKSVLKHSKLTKKMKRCRLLQMEQMIFQLLKLSIIKQKKRKLRRSKSKEGSVSVRDKGKV